MGIVTVPPGRAYYGADGSSILTDDPTAGRRSVNGRGEATHGERIIKMFCGNGCNSNLWLIIILILLFGSENGFGCGCGCGNNNGCGC